MTDSDVRLIPAACAAWLAAHPEWAPLPGAAGYEASHRGFVRSIDRTVKGRRLRGVTLKPTVNNSGYHQVNVTYDGGMVRKPTVHSCVLRAYFGPPPRGMETLHGPGGPLDNRYCGCGTEGCTEGNLRYGTWEENDAERTAALAVAGRAANGRAVPEPKAPRLCILCGEPVTNGGRRCHGCVVRIGREASALLRDGVRPEAAAARLDYPSVSGLLTLAARYGEPVPARPPWSRRVAVTLRGIFGRRRAR